MENKDEYVKAYEWWMTMGVNTSQVAQGLSPTAYNAAQANVDPKKWKAEVTALE